MKKKISVVIPTYNEEANVVPLAKAVSEVMELTPAMNVRGRLKTDPVMHLHTA